MYSNTVKNVSRAIAWIDRNASAGLDDMPEHGDKSTLRSKLISLSSGIAYELSRAGIAHHKSTDRDIVVILAAHGMSAFSIEQFAHHVADMVRGDFQQGSMSNRDASSVAADAVSSAIDWE